MQQSVCVDAMRMSHANIYIRTGPDMYCCVCSHQKSKHQQRQVAEELFNANVRVQKQSALPVSSAAVAKAGRGRGRARGKAMA